LKTTSAILFQLVSDKEFAVRLNLKESSAHSINGVANVN
jgi:hypothetical protein